MRTHEKVFQPRITLVLEHPRGAAEGAQAMAEFLGKVRWQVEQAFESLCSERNWPTVRWAFELTEGLQDFWLYRTEGARASELEGRVEPSKYIVVGPPEELDRLIGVETLDSTFQLPAKWIGRSQVASVDTQSLLILDGPGAIAYHLLSNALTGYSHLLGWADVWRWLNSGFQAENPALTPTLLSQRFHRLYPLLISLIEDDLVLEGPGPFCESALTALEREGDHEAAYRTLRRDALRRNLARWQDEAGQLNAVEWKHEPDAPESASSRRVERLIGILLEQQAAPGPRIVVITDCDCREFIRQVVRRHCGGIPILGWEELPEDLAVTVVASVDGSLDLDPSPWHLAEYRFEEKFHAFGNIPEEADV